MTEKVDTEQTDDYERQQNREEMKKQMISFSLMIILTLMSFGLVATGNLNKVYAIPLLLVMAVVQVAFQFYYFMHLKDKGHGMPATLIFGGVWAAFLTLAALGVISWW